MEFSERPLRGGLSVFIGGDIWLMSAFGTRLGKTRCHVDGEALGITVGAVLSLLTATGART
jgi:hypothetical protein